jgi:predicted flap endonuclease-1-like 5' DNA nuclease
MTTEAQLRQAALALPEVVESDGAFRVHDVVFVSDVPGVGVQLVLDTADAESLLEQVDAAEESAGGVALPLDALNGQQLNHWVRRAWLACAPDDLVDAVLVADSAEPGTVGDLPAAIGSPATRALAGAGITTLAQVADHSDGDLLALHGVGPKAVRILREAIG